MLLLGKQQRQRFDKIPQCDECSRYHTRLFVWAGLRIPHLRLPGNINKLGLSISWSHVKNQWCFSFLITITMCTPLQINTQALDVEELCTFSGEQHNPEMDMVLREWESTNSPLIHWYNAIVKVSRRKSMGKAEICCKLLLYYLLFRIALNTTLTRSWVTRSTSYMDCQGWKYRFDLRGGGWEVIVPL